MGPTTKKAAVSEKLKLKILRGCMVIDILYPLEKKTFNQLYERFFSVPEDRNKINLSVMRNLMNQLREATEGIVRTQNGFWHIMRGYPVDDPKEDFKRKEELKELWCKNHGKLWKNQEPKTKGTIKSNQRENKKFPSGIIVNGDKPSKNPEKINPEIPDLSNIVKTINIPNTGKPVQITIVITIG